MPSNENSKHLPLEQQTWFQNAYEQAKLFYDRDNVLDRQDRLELAKTYDSISRAQLWGGWAGFGAVFLTPFAYRFYHKRPIAGIKVPRNFIFGVMAMFLTTQVAGNLAFNNKLKELDPDGSLANSTHGADDDGLTVQWDAGTKRGPYERSKRCYQMLTLLGTGTAPRWANYFTVTADNPGRRLPNPAEKLKELQSGKPPNFAGFMNQRDPIGLYSDKQSKTDDSKDRNKKAVTVEPQFDQGNSSWDKVRREQVKNDDNNISAWDRVRQNAKEKSKNGQDPNDSTESIFGFDDD